MSPYARFAVGARMNVASPETVVLFNHRGADQVLGNLALISGRDRQSRDGVKVLYNVLKDAVDNHDQTCLKIPKKATIKFKSKYF